MKNPVNVVIELSNTTLTIQNLIDAGARRISIGSVLFLTAYGSLIRAANELQKIGQINFVSGAASFSELEKIFSEYKNESG